MGKYKFSGHETFPCRFFWLKKGYDFTIGGGDFKSNDALIELGVGKNMVSSINHWLKAFMLKDDVTGRTTEFGDFVFGVNGKDPYLESLGSIFLLHYSIVKNSSRASLYRLAFDEFRRTRIDSEFTASSLFDFVGRKLRADKTDFSEKSLKNDIKVFIKMYHVAQHTGSKSLEEDFSSVLIDLKLIEPIEGALNQGEQVYRIQYGVQRDLSEFILLYGIMDTFSGETSIAVEDVQRFVSDLFLCNREGTEEKLNNLDSAGFIVYKEDAGRKEIQIKQDLSKWDVLKKYYDKL